MASCVKEGLFFVGEDPQLGHIRGLDPWAVDNGIHLIRMEPDKTEGIMMIRESNQQQPALHRRSFFSWTLTQKQATQSEIFSMLAITRQIIAAAARTHAVSFRIQSVIFIVKPPIHGCEVSLVYGSILHDNVEKYNAPARFFPQLSKPNGAAPAARQRKDGIYADSER